MNRPAGYFEHTPTIRTEGQMMATLKARAKPQAKLHWETPIRNADGSGSQIAAGTAYVIRKAAYQDKWMYWAWHDRKLLGYSPDVEIARTHCEAHHLNRGTP